jgi:hypothetical protein
MEKGLLRVFFAAAIFCVWVNLLTPSSALALPPERKLGSVNFPTSCSPSVQKTMETGLALLHSFQYQEAEQAFSGAAHDDPKCALAYWGKAMALYQPLWDFPNARALELGRRYVEQAQKLETGDARIHGYISAAAAFFQSAKLTPAARTRAYSLAMEKLYREQPEDNEAGELYALSFIALAQMGIDDLANRKKAIAILNPIFLKYPESPGAAHYLIHAADTRELAPEALAAAQAYAKIAPDSAHALHMPSHIFRRLGMWQAMIDSNLASAAAAAEVSKKHYGGADYQLHALDFLDYAYLQSGQEAKARQLVAELKGVAGAAPADVIDAQNRFAARNALELHHWKEAAALAIPKEKLEFQDYTYWTRAIGAARSGDVQGARADVQKLVEIAQLVNSKQMSAEGSGSTSGAGMAIDPSEAAGWLAYAEHKPDEALRILRGAAAREDAQDAEPFAMPAREMLADLLLELGKPAEALAEYKNVLKNFPNRFNALVGAARAADLSGDTRAASKFYLELLAHCSPNADRPELQDAKKYLAAHPD